MIHRTAKKFLKSKRMHQKILDITGHDDFDCEEHWASCDMGIYKAVKGDPVKKWNHLSACIEGVLRLQTAAEACPFGHIDEVGRVTMLLYKDYRTSENATTDAKIAKMLPTVVSAFLDYAVWMHLAEYVRIKGKQVSREDLVHAERFKNIEKVIRSQQILESG